MSGMSLLHADGLLLLRQIVARIDEVVFIISPESDRILYVSPSYERVWGRSCESLYDNFSSWIDAIHPEDRERIRIEMGVPSEVEELRHEFRIVHTDGTVRWIRTRTCALKDDSGQVHRLVGIAQDLTERHRTAFVRREADARITRVLESITDAFLAFDEEWRCTYANGVSERVTQRNRSELLGNVLWEVFPEMLATAFSRDCKRAIDQSVTTVGEAYWPELHAWHEHVIYPSPDGATLYLRDVTEHKSAADALAQSAMALAEAQRVGHVGSWHWDLSTNAVRWSDELYHIYGLPPGEAPLTLEILKSCVDVASPPDSAAAIEPRTWESKYVRQDGGVRLLRNRSDVLLDAAGKPAALVGTVHDLTEQKLAQENLLAVESRFHAVVEAMNDGLLLTDLSGAILYANGRLADLTGYAGEELIGRNSAQLLVPLELRGREAELLSGSLGGAQTQIECELIRKDGRRFWAEVKASPFRDANQKIIGSVALITDISERRQVVEVLRQSERQLAQAQEIAQLGSFLWQIEAQRLTWSSEGLAILGLTKPEAPATIEQFIEQVCAGDRKELQQAFESARQAGHAPYLEVRLLRPNAQARTVLVGLLVSFGDEGTGVEVNGTLQDVTERRAEEEKHRAIERKLIETQKLDSLGLLAGGIAHDFNNLLTGILGNASLARAELPAESEARTCIHEIETLALRAADLCQQLLACSGKRSVLLQRVDLNQLLAQSANLMRLAIGTHALLEFDLDQELPAIEADPLQIEQAIMNLVINASDALGSRGGVIKLRTGTVSGPIQDSGGAYFSAELPPGEYLFVEIVDSGRGIDPKILPAILEPFFTTKPNGRGLGLSATLGIVRGHNGTLCIQSDRSTGTTCRVIFPLLPTQPRIQPAAPERIAPPGRGAVLVVDDEDSVRNVAGRLLTSLGFEVLLASSGTGALELMRENLDGVRAVLLDLTMPQMDGVETFHALQSLSPRVRIILMSGYGERDALARFSPNGLAGFVQKPFTAESLRQKVMATLAVPDVIYSNSEFPAPRP